MAGLYNYEYYHNNCGPIAYEDPKHWVEFFGVIADHIVADLAPKTVLDAGCAMGYLVAALRDRGVEAYGIDISDYAISKVREDVRPYCVVGSLTEPLPEVLPQRYDLVVTIEVLEHLYEEEGKQVIRNLCALSNHILFSSTPNDFKERTHFNVQQREYWARLFASEGFLDDLNYRPTYLTAYASYFKKSANWLRQLAQVQYAYNVISNAFFWKITKPFRVVLDGIKGLLKSNRYTYLCWKGLKCWKENGTKYTWKKVEDKLHHRQDFTKAVRPLFTEEELEEQRRDIFPREVKFSIVVPLYNTPEEFLHEMIQSVLDQTYENWELCMADGSDSEHQSIEKICRQYIRKDSRIKYRKLERNLGISENTNACIDMASGDYIALFDHDDLLHPAALHEVMKAICGQNADFIYTDENTFHRKPEDAYCPHFKPDFAPDTLRSYNYICHFTVFQSSLLNQTGKFQGEFDGSQDYDMILRLTECASHIIHIPEILYYWRAHQDSVAEKIDAKPYTLHAARCAIKAHLDRVGLKGKVLDSIVPSTYRICYELEEAPLISIIIPNMDHVHTLRTCIESILKKTSYPNYEIIVVENNSKKSETFSYYEELKENPHVQIVIWTDKFNYSAINNFGVQYANGDYFLLLNNDIEVISEDWLQEMLMFCQRKDVGVVGAMLYYPDDTIQHAGVILGVGGVAGHSHKYFSRNESGYMCRATIAQNLSAVTGACMMVRRDVWVEMDGLDTEFEVAFNDVDFCMRIRKAGYLIVWTPYAELYHYESKSRGFEDTPEKQKRFAKEIQRFKTRWRKELGNGDPYYNPNLTLDREDFSLS